MHICLDYRPALRQATGVGTYVRNLLAALCRDHPEDDFTAFSASWRHRLHGIHGPSNLRVCDRRVPVRALDWCWHRWAWPPVEWFVGDPQVVHSPSPMLMPARRACQVVTVHDCYFLRHPEDVSGPVRRDYVPLARRSAGQADAVICPSATTARDVEELLHVPAQRIRVTPLGVEQIYHRGALQTSQAMAGRLRQLGAVPPYLLFVGRRERRKDLGTLLAALDQLAVAGLDCRLLLVGPSAPGWEETRRSAPARARELTRCLPHQSPETLVHLYAAAAALVVPSRWEGFGLPALEAMAVGTPVVATRVGALPEVLGDAPLWVSRGDATELAEACRRVLEDRELAAALVERGRRRAGRYRWEATAAGTHALYRELAA